MRKFRLKNGMTVIADQRKSEAVAIGVCVHTGSNNETQKIAGISHFLEHMLFEGTKTRTAQQISETIENVGGELNAMTWNERTYYYITLTKSKAILGLEILSDMICNPAFKQKSFDKEKKVILEEIRLINDQPSAYQWILFEKKLFRRHPTKNPVYGRVDSVKATTRQQMINYFRKWYTPNNMSLVLVGDIKAILPKVNSYFGSVQGRACPTVRHVTEPAEKKPRIFRETRKINQSYMVLGYKTVPRSHKDSTILDVISAIFSKGLSGRVSDEIRRKRGLAYSVGTEHESNKDYGFFAFHLNTEKKNAALCKKIVLDEVGKLSDIGTKELNHAKDHIIGNTLLRNEEAKRQAENLAFWEFISDAKMADDYLKKVKKVTVNDIIRVRNRYFKNNYTLVRLESR